MLNLFDETVLTQTDAASTSAGTEVDSTAVAIAEYDGCAFIASLGSHNAGNYFKVQGSADGSTNWTDLAGSKYVPQADAAGCMLTVERSSYAYHRLVAIRAGTNTIVSAIFALLYRTKKQRPLGLNKGAQLVNPAAGTA